MRCAYSPSCFALTLGGHFSGSNLWPALASLTTLVDDDPMLGAEPDEPSCDVPPADGWVVAQGFSCLAGAAFFRFGDIADATPQWLGANTVRSELAEAITA